MKNRKYTNRSYLNRLQDQVMIFDGAMGTNLQKLNLTADDFGGEIFMGCNDILSLTRPQAIEEVSSSFLHVGVDVIETNTFRSNRVTLAEYGLDDRTEEINFSAARLSKKLSESFSKNGQPRFVAGSMGPSGKLPSMDDPELSDITFSELVLVYQEQSRGLIKGGVDLLLIETSQDILELKAVINGIYQAFAETGVWLPIQAQVTLDTNGRMLLGSNIGAVLAILQGMPIDVIGMNCSTGPEHMREPLKFLTSHTNLPVSCIPNAGLPLNVNGEAVYPLEPEPYALELNNFIEELHVRVVGGCCGTTPEHLSQLVKLAGGKKTPVYVSKFIPALASGIQAVPMHQEPRPFLIGERLNTQGSRKFKRLMLEEDFESAMQIANQQLNHGAHALDICVALTEKNNENKLMQRLIKTLSPLMPIPFVIDSTELSVMQTALETSPGRCLINSTNLDGGREKADKVFDLARKYNAAVMALTIDEQGMAKTAARKLKIAEKIYDIAVNEHGLHPSALVFDPLTFTLSTGDSEYELSAVETLKGIRLIKEKFPDCFISLGVSNISFGLPPSAREVINSVMLYHAIQAGLDMAIVNPALIEPFAEIPAETRQLAEDLIFFRRKDALKRVMEYFKDKSGESATRIDKKLSALEELPVEKRLQQRIILRVKENVEKDIDECIRTGIETGQNERALFILNKILLPGMKEVGDRFSSGELILPFVLESAEVMKKAIAHLEIYLDQDSDNNKGTIVLATVYGDVHDIGKNLAKTILSNNGYRVIDLGKQVPAETIISSAVDHKADAIGLSALLVSTSREMEKIVNELQRRKMSFPVLVGGAAINSKFSERLRLTDQNEVYQPGVYYCRDAFDGLKAMDQITSVENIEEEKELRSTSIPEKIDKTQLPAVQKTGCQKSAVQASERIPQPPFWGAAGTLDISLNELDTYLDKKALFRLSWGGKNQKGENWKKIEADFEKRLQRMWQDLQNDPWLEPRGLYGYFPVKADGEYLLIFDSQTINLDQKTEILRLNNPRQRTGECLSLSDYFLSLEQTFFDVVPLQIVTVGAKATQKFDYLQEKGDFSEAYFCHGLAVQVTEAAAAWLHDHIRKELGLEKDQGKRYAWGFSAIPNLDEHKKVFSLLPAEKELGMSLTSAFQLVPEQSTAAIIVHHPDAKYF